MSLVTDDGRTRVAVEKPDASRITIFTHDWTDPTTWYTTSVHVVDESASDDGDHTAYSLANAPIVDTYHGKIFGEDQLAYRVIVKVDGVTKTEQDPHLGIGGDYTIDYLNAQITFTSAQSPSATVLVSYYRVVDSTFIVRPATGKVLICDLAEVQFSEDIELRDTTQFQPYGYVDVFAPQYMPGIPSGTKIPLGAPTVYKTMRDFQAEAVRSYPKYPAMGGSSWRGMTQGVIVMDWDYLASTRLRSDYGLEIRIKLQHDVPFGGAYGTATFYCTSENL